MEPPEPQVNVRGKRVLVVGAARGVGRAIAEGLAALGARLVLDDTGADLEGRGADPGLVEEVARGIRDRGGEAIARALDAAEPGVAEALVATARRELGRLDALVVTAAAHRERTLLRTSDEDVDALWRAPTLASIRCARAAARAFVEQGSAPGGTPGGSIVLASGAQAFFGVARQGLLGAAGAAVAGFVRASALELRRHGVRVNALVPTARTRANEHLPTFRGVRPDSLGPEHVVPVAAFLVSDASREVTGEAVGIAGGRLYLIRSRETPGAFARGLAFTPDEIAMSWPEAARG